MLVQHCRRKPVGVESKFKIKIPFRNPIIMLKIFEFTLLNPNNSHRFSNLARKKPAT